MAEHEGLMAVSETERGQVSNSAVSVIYETVLLSEKEKHWSPKGRRLGFHLTP